MGIINSTIPIMVLIFFGYFCKKYWIIDDHFWKKINELVYYFMFPCLMISSIGRANLSDLNIDFIYVLIFICVLMIILCWIIKPIFKQTSFWVVFTQGTFRYNSYIFIGVTYYYVGTQAAPVISVITASMILFANVIGVFILNAYSEIKKSVIQTIISTFKNPLVISCIIGLLVNYLTSFNTGLREIIWINHSLDNIGNASLAMSLIAVGATLHIKSAADKMTGVIFCAVIKLLVMPLLVFILLKFLNFNNELILICMIYAGSPCSSNATPMVASMGGDAKTMSLIISTQTVLSVFTIPVILFIYRMQLI